MWSGVQVRARCICVHIMRNTLQSVGCIYVFIGLQPPVRAECVCVCDISLRNPQKQTTNNNTLILGLSQRLALVRRHTSYKHGKHLHPYNPGTDADTHTYTYTHTHRHTLTHTQTHIHKYRPPPRRSHTQPPTMTLTPVKRYTHTLSENVTSFRASCVHVMCVSGTSMWSGFQVRARCICLHIMRNSLQCVGCIYTHTYTHTHAHTYTHTHTHTET